METSIKSSKNKFYSALHDLLYLFNFCEKTFITLYMQMFVLSKFSFKIMKIGLITVMKVFTVLQMVDFHLMVNDK